MQNGGGGGSQENRGREVEEERAEGERSKRVGGGRNRGKVHNNA